jgi:hypothetical protein
MRTSHETKKAPILYHMKCHTVKHFFPIRPLLLLTLGVHVSRFTFHPLPPLLKPLKREAQSRPEVRRGLPTQNPLGQ